MMKLIMSWTGLSRSSHPVITGDWEEERDTGPGLRWMTGGLMATLEHRKVVFTLVVTNRVRKKVITQPVRVRIRIRVILRMETTPTLETSSRAASTAHAAPGPARSIRLSVSHVTYTRG